MFGTPTKAQKPSRHRTGAGRNRVKSVSSLNQLSASSSRHKANPAYSQALDRYDFNDSPPVHTTATCLNFFPK